MKAAGENRAGGRKAGEIANYPANSRELRHIPNVVWRGKKAHFVVRVNGRQIWRSLHTTYHTVARDRASEMRWRLAMGEDPLRLAPKVEEPSLEAIRERWEASRARELRANTVTSTRRRFEAFRLWALAKGVQHASEILPEHLLDYRSARTAEASATTAASDLRAVKTICNFARRMRWTAAAPFLDLPRQPRPAVAEKPLTPWPKLRKAILAARGEPHFPALSIAALAGLRRGELAHLRWEDLDFARREIHIINRPGEFLVKTAEARTVPLAAWIGEVLTRGRVSHIGRASHAGRIWKSTEDALSQAIGATLKAAGIPGGIHGLRHNWITHLLLAGYPLASVMAWAGHSNISTTQGYLHVRQAVSREDVEAFAAAFGVPR